MSLTRRDLIQGAAAGLLLPLGARWSDAMAETAESTLGAIRAVTITATDLPAVEAAWTKFMEYRLVERGKLSAAIAKSWGAPALQGARYIILGPASEEPFYLRFVEQATPANYDPTKSWGWNGAEVTVQNTPELYERLKDSPFTITRPPREVPTYPYLLAMGAIGPAGEKLNLTWIKERRPDLAVAKSFVGRCFMTVETVPDLPKALDFYRTTFGSKPSPIRKLPTVELAVVPLNDGCKIEVDQFKGENGQPRARVGQGLPPGVAMVTFECSAFDKLQDKYLSTPIENVIEPFKGRRVAVMHGPAGALMELVEV